MVLFMPQSVYGLTAGDKFLIAATATLVGSALRLPYTMATPRFGGRNWTVFSACVLVAPVVATIVVLAEPGRPLWVYLVCAALCGLGGGNFASSMTNINAFFPQRLKGWALGINAGGGNIGVPAVLLVGLLVIAIAGDRQPYWVCAFYLVALVIAATGAARFMDNLDVVSVDTRAMRAGLRNRHTWLVSLLYIGTFAHSSASRSRSVRCCRLPSPRVDRARYRRHCTPPKSPSSGRCSARLRGSTVADAPTGSAAAPSRCGRSSA
jgi:MFS transporter, NNP family, nitrate/nitrite transporter